MKICNLKDHLEYTEEVARLTQQEWSDKNLSTEEFHHKIIKKIEKMKRLFMEPYYCKLILLEEKELIGFISIFPHDGEEEKELTPWYATMYVKEFYRGKGYSKILNDAILKEASKMGIKKIYLKSALKNYYEKFGAIYIKDLKNGEKLYYIQIK